MCILRRLWKIVWTCLVVFSYLFAALVVSSMITLIFATVISFGSAVGNGFDPSVQISESVPLVWAGRIVFIVSFFSISFFSLLDLWREQKKLRSYELSDNLSPGLD